MAVIRAVPKSWASGDFRVSEHEVESRTSTSHVAVGTIRRETWTSRKARVELPDELPLPVRVFVLWLVLLMWKRESDAAASSGGGH